MSSPNRPVSAEGPVAYVPVAKEESAEGDDSRRQLWAPFFLRRPAMIAFVICNLACLGGLIALYVYTERQSHTVGIKTEDRFYYLWTYGPTAGTKHREL